MLARSSKDSRSNRGAGWTVYAPRSAPLYAKDQHTERRAGNEARAHDGKHGEAPPVRLYGAERAHKDSEPEQAGADQVLCALTHVGPLVHRVVAPLGS